MLKTRIITTFFLLLILLPILFFNNFYVFFITMLLFLGAGILECLYLFQITKKVLLILYCIIMCLFIILINYMLKTPYFFTLCLIFSILYFILTLIFKLPQINTFSNYLLSIIYIFELFRCFSASLILFQHSPLYLLSVMIIVWIADIGAYFIGKNFGRHKLIQSISPNKSWEGVIGGLLAVLTITTITAIYFKKNTFLMHLYSKLNFVGFIFIITLLVIVSIIGDLFESQLKRRAGTKDSSSLLPGHGGILDRIDSMVLVLPCAILIDFWL